MKREKGMRIAREGGECGGEGFKSVGERERGEGEGCGVRVRMWGGR